MVEKRCGFNCIFVRQRSASLSQATKPPMISLLKVQVEVEVDEGKFHEKYSLDLERIESAFGVAGSDGPRGKREILSLAGRLLAIYLVAKSSSEEEEKDTCLSVGRGIGMKGTATPTATISRRYRNLQWHRNPTASNRPFIILLNHQPQSQSAAPTRTCTLAPDFNISHHGNLVVAACISSSSKLETKVKEDCIQDDVYISNLKRRQCRLGVDLVIIDPVALGDISIFANQGIFHPSLEWPWIIDGDEEGDTGLFSSPYHRFAVLWALKEAFVKALCGNALADEGLDLTRIVFTIRRVFNGGETTRNASADNYCAACVDLLFTPNSNDDFYTSISKEEFSFTCHAWINSEKSHVIALCLITPLASSCTSASTSTSLPTTASAKSIPHIKNIEFQDLLDYFK